MLDSDFSLLKLFQISVTGIVREMSSCDVLKEEVTCEMEEEDEKETKRTKKSERTAASAAYQRKQRELARRLLAGEYVPGIGEEERRRIIEKEETRKQKNRERMRKAAAERARIRELDKKLRAGEEVKGVSEEERRKILEREERRRQKNRENMRKILAEEGEKGKVWRSVRAKEKRERIRRVCAGEDVPGVGEEERRRIIEGEERRKQKSRERMKKVYETRLTRERMERERVRRICAAEDVPGVGEEERRKIIEKEEMKKRKRRASSVKYYQRRKKEETEEEREARLARNKFKMLMWRVQRTKEEMRRRNYFNRQAKLAMMSEEEREGEKRRRSEWHKEWRRNLSEEKRRIYEESVKRSSKRWLQKLKERGVERINTNVNYHQIYNKEKWEAMSEDEKRRRLNQMKMYKQKRNLRRKLEGTMDDEEIERRLDELDKRLRQELSIGPPRPRGWSGKRSSDCGPINNDASCPEVDQWSDNSSVNLNSATCYQDSQAIKEEQAENIFCDFDEGTSMPSTPEATQLNDPSSPHPPQQHLEPVASFIVPEIVDFTFSCEYCERSTFLTEKDLKSHLRHNHLKICLKCPSCKEVMISSKHLSEHFEAVHEKTSILPSLSNVDAHIPQNLQAKEPALDAPSVPHNISQEKSNLGKSGDCLGSKAEFLCLRCPLILVNSSKIIMVFKNWKELHSHVWNNHRKYYWPCEYCHLLKYSKQSLSVHQVLCRKKSEMLKELTHW